MRVLKNISVDADGVVTCTIVTPKTHKIYLVRINDNVVTWYNSDDNIIYTVTKHATCDCPGHKHYPSLECRHVAATRKLVQLGYLKRVTVTTFLGGLQ